MIVHGFTAVAFYFLCYLSILCILFPVWFIDDCHQHEAFNWSHMLNPSSPMFRLFRHTDATSTVCKRLQDTIFPFAVHFSTSLFKWADALLEHMPSASTGYALGSVLHCFTTSLRWRSPKRLIMGATSEREVLYVYFKQIINSYWSVLTTWSLAFFFYLKIQIDYLPKELSVGVANFPNLYRFEVNSLVLVE